MGRKQTNTYESTPFSRRICQLQKEREYSDQEVIEGVVDDNGNPLITGKQAYDTHKRGRSQPNNLQDMLRGYARFYGVSVDYLLEMTDSPTPEIGKVEEITGLGTDAIKRLTALKEGSPELLEIIDAIISAVSIEDIFNLNRWVYKSYKGSKTSMPDILRNSYQLEQDSFARELCRFILSVVIDRMAPSFDKEMLIEDAERNQYEHPYSAPSEQTTIITNITVTPVEDDNNSNNNDN